MSKEPKGTESDAYLVVVLAFPAAESASRLAVEVSADGSATTHYFVDDTGRRWLADLAVLTSVPGDLFKDFRRGAH